MALIATSRHHNTKGVKFGPKDITIEIPLAPGCGLWSKYLRNDNSWKGPAKLPTEAQCLDKTAKAIRNATEMAIAAGIGGDPIVPILWTE